MKIFKILTFINRGDIMKEVKEVKRTFTINNKLLDEFKLI